MRKKKINAGLEQGTAVNRRCSNTELADAKFKKEKEKKSLSVKVDVSIIMQQEWIDVSRKYPYTTIPF